MLLVCTLRMGAASVMASRGATATACVFEYSPTVFWVMNYSVWLERGRSEGFGLRARRRGRERKSLDYGRLERRDSVWREGLA